VCAVITTQDSLCRHCGFPIAHVNATWTHVVTDGSDVRLLHPRCRLSSHLRHGRSDDHLPKLAAATPWA
jgi:hypothetical protein